MSIPSVLSVRHKSVCGSQNILCETEMKVLINPTREQLGSGLTASVTWDNPDVKTAMNRLFNVHGRREKITQIEISREGIVARMEYIPTGK